MKKQLRIFLWVFTITSVVHAASCKDLFQVINGMAPSFSFSRTTPTEKNLETVSFQLQDQIDAVCLKEGTRLGKPRDQIAEATLHAAFVAGELFNNAARWGNRFDPNKNIAVQVFATPEGIVVSVKDEGAKPFDPFEDPGSRKPNESEPEFAKRRAKMGKPLKTNATHGVFWHNLKQADFDYAYGFSEGSTVIVRIPWSYGRPPS